MERDIASDPGTGLRLVADASDPPRYYIQRRRRSELIAIGTEQQARSCFTSLVRKTAISNAEPLPNEEPNWMAAS
jgi:hypothetical protein